MRRLRIESGFFIRTFFGIAFVNGCHLFPASGRRIMSHDLRQAFTMVIGFVIGFSMALIFMPSNLALAMTSGVVCGLLAGAFFAQVSYGDVFWHVGEFTASDEGVGQPSMVPKTLVSTAGRTRFSNGRSPADSRADNQADGRTGKPAQKKHSTNIFSTSRFHVMITGSSARQKKNIQKEKANWVSHQRAQTFIPGRQEQQGRRYQRRVKPREGLRIES